MKHHQAQSGCRKRNAFLDQPNPLLSARANELIIQQAFFLKSLYIQSKWKFWKDISGEDQLALHESYKPNHSLSDHPWLE